MTNSPDVAATESLRLSLDPSRVQVLNNPVVDTATWRPFNSRSVGPPSADEAVRLVVVGRLARDKRVDLALGILRGVLEHRPASLTVVGTGPDEERLRSLTSHADLSDHVHFVGYSPAPRAYMAEAHVLVHTAEREGFGNVVVEALYESLPVVCTSCSGPPYIIDYGRFGAEIGAADAESTVAVGVAAVLNIVNGHITYEGLHQRALEFTVEAATRQLVQLVESAG